MFLGNFAGRLYGVRGIVNGQEHLALGYAAQLLPVLKQLSGGGAGVEVLPLAGRAARAHHWQAYLASSGAPMLMIGSPFVARDLEQAQWAAAELLLRGRVGAVWPEAQSGDVHIYDGERIALRLADESQLSRDFLGSHHLAVNEAVDQDAFDRWVFHGEHPTSRYLWALSNAAERCPELFTNSVRVQLALQIRQRPCCTGPDQ